MTQQPIDILYFVEHVARELDVACVFLATYRQQHPNIQIKIASARFNMADTVKRYRPKVVITPYCYDQESYIYKYLLPAYGNSAHYINLAFEQIVSDSLVYKKLPQDDFAKNVVTHVVWSEHFAQQMRDHGTGSSNIIVNGNPSFPLYHPPLASQTTSKEQLAWEFKLDAQKPWLFIPGNFGPAFWDRDRQRRKLAEGYSQAYIENYMEHSKKTFRHILKWLEQSEASQCFEVVLRPKPAVPLDQYKAFVRENCSDNKVSVIKDYTIREWILASDLVASNFSTSLIDAAIAEKTNILLSPYPLEGDLHASWHNHAVCVRSFTEFQKSLENIDSLDTRALASWAQDYLNPKAIEHLVHLCHDKLASPSQTNDISQYDKTIPKNPNLVSNIDDFSEQDVQERLEAWRQVLPM